MHFITRTCIIFIMAAAMAAAARAEATLRIACYNIRAARGMDNRIDLQRTAEVLRRFDADVILLQEVDMGTKRSGEVFQATELGKMLGMHAYFAKAMNYGGGEYGNAILSKLPFAKTSTLPLIGGAEERAAGIVELIVPKNGAKKTDAKTAGDGMRVMLISVHLDARKRDVHVEHVKEISAEVARLTAERPAAAVIWGGDFNATETSPIWDVLKKDHAWIMPEKQGATKAARSTIPSTKPNKEIDWFLYKTDKAANSTLKVLEYKVASEPVASDHCPIIFTASLAGGKKE